jgi:hypothetical protein
MREGKMEKENKPDSVRSTLVTLIGNLLAKYKTSKKDNTKEILMLVAALSIINAGTEDDNKQSLAVARRLISGAK